jgi:hypothetical protein
MGQGILLAAPIEFDLVRQLCDPTRSCDGAADRMKHLARSRVNTLFRGSSMTWVALS